MEAVVTYRSKTPTPQVTATQMLTLPTKIVDEFIGCWGVQWEASLKPEVGKKVTQAFSTTLGHPSSPQLLVLTLQIAKLWRLDL